MTFVSRVRVTGGFLDGLDLRFGPGLNVVVGPRGAGKTTLLELLRHALALSDETRARDRAAFLRHALGAGEVVLDLNTPSGAERLVVDAEGGGARPELTEDLALMLGQNELEEIADSPTRRLALIDMRAGIAPDDQLSSVDELKRLTLRAQHLRERQEGLQDLLRQKTSLLEDRERLREREAQMLARNANALGPQRERLAELERDLLRVRSELRGADSLRATRHKLAEALNPLLDIIGAAEAESVNVESPIRGEVAQLVATVKGYVQGIDEAANHLERLSTGSLERLQVADVRLRAEAEPVRTSLDQAEKGLGAITAELRDLDAQLDRLSSAELELEDLQVQEQRTLAERQLVQETLEDYAERLFDARDRAARSITDKLDHRVQIAVRHLADTNAYRRTISELLQGSGLQYNALAEVLSTSTLPLALLRYVEQGDVDGLSQTSGLVADRALRVLAALNSGASLTRIAATTLNDSVDFRLQDGAALKSAAELSTGQKCAVTMPIVLTDTSRIVILDQPEDHLDNQFLVERVVTSLIARSEAGAQTIVATHNPNIPVLGSAIQVASLASDGTHGQVEAQGPFDAPAVVKVITSLMEGGRRAFDQRAEFYAAHRGS